MEPSEVGWKRQQRLAPVQEELEQVALAQPRGALLAGAAQLAGQPLVHQNCWTQRHGGVTAAAERGGRAARRRTEKHAGASHAAAGSPAAAVNYAEGTAGSPRMCPSRSRSSSRRSPSSRGRPSTKETVVALAPPRRRVRREHREVGLRQRERRHVGSFIVCAGSSYAPAASDFYLQRPSFAATSRGKMRRPRSPRRAMSVPGSVFSDGTPTNFRPMRHIG